MTPEQLALAQIELAKLQLWITGLAIFLGPLAGVLFTFWFQSRKDKELAKHRLFLALMGERNALVMSPQIAQALNTINIVFAKNQKVISLWHKYYALLSRQPGEERVHTWLELLEAMAQDLGYPKISQTDIDKFYVPQGHADDLEFQRKVSKQWARVLENTERFVVVPREEIKTTS